MSKFIKNMGPRLAAVAVWGAVAISIWYWVQATIAINAPSALKAQRIASNIEAYDPVAMARLLGSSLLAPVVPSVAMADRFMLSGIVASSTGQGAALISVDGAPAQPFRVGAELAPGFVLVAVAPRDAMLADGLNAAVQAVLSLPLRGSAQTSTALPAANENVDYKLSTAAATAHKAEADVVVLSVGQQVSEKFLVPPRLDARLQPETSLRRNEIRAP